MMIKLLTNLQKEKGKKNKEKTKGQKKKKL